MSAFAYLLLAIASEVIATTALRLSEGLTRLVPSVVMALGYGAAFYLLSQALKKGMPIGTSYAIWSGLGTAVIAVIGLVLFREALTAWRLAGIALIIAGVLILNLLGGAH